LSRKGFDFDDEGDDDSDVIDDYDENCMTNLIQNTVNNRLFSRESTFYHKDLDRLTQYCTN